MGKMTINEAVEKWVDGFNAIPRGMIQELMDADPDSWMEITPPVPGDRVYVYDECTTGTIIGIEEGGEQRLYRIRFDNTDIAEDLFAKDDFEAEVDSLLPMWGTMWSFGSGFDNDWLEDEDNLRQMAACGFRIYEHKKWGYFFGIDGAGYSFMEEHFIPLYRARGLRWHE